jgi:hypothetical protein
MVAMVTITSAHPPHPVAGFAGDSTSPHRGEVKRSVALALHLSRRERSSRPPQRVIRVRGYGARGAKGGA